MEYVGSYLDNIFDQHARTSGSVIYLPDSIKTLTQQVLDKGIYNELKSIKIQELKQIVCESQSKALGEVIMSMEGETFIEFIKILRSKEARSRLNNSDLPQKVVSKIIPYVDDLFSKLDMKKIKKFRGWNYLTVLDQRNGLPHPVGIPMECRLPKKAWSTMANSLGGFEIHSILILPPKIGSYKVQVVFHYSAPKKALIFKSSFIKEKIGREYKKPDLNRPIILGVDANRLSEHIIAVGLITPEGFIPLQIGRELELITSLSTKLKKVQDEISNVTRALSFYENDLVKIRGELNPSEMLKVLRMGKFKKRLRQIMDNSSLRRFNEAISSEGGFHEGVKMIITKLGHKIAKVKVQLTNLVLRETNLRQEIFREVSSVLGMLLVKYSCVGLAAENLTITPRGKTKYLSKLLRDMPKTASIFQQAVRQATAYHYHMAQETRTSPINIPLIKVDPYGTSKICAVCGAELKGVKGNWDVQICPNYEEDKEQYQEHHKLWGSIFHHTYIPRHINSALIIARLGLKKWTPDSNKLDKRFL
ncbi:MAG: hypothetical protein ACTSQI_21505 [Candidatus Helarchaeota archaeon]